MPHLRSLWPYARPYRTGLVIGLLLVVAANLFTAAAPWVLRLVLDAMADPDATRAVIVRYALLMVALAVVGGAARFGMRELLNGISRRIECDLREDFFRHLLRLDAAWYGQARTGDIMARVTHDTLAVRQAVGPAIMYAVNTAVMSVLAVGLMFWISPRLSLLALIPMVLLPPVVLGFGRIIHDRFERIQEQYSALSTLVQENLTGVRLVRAFGQEADQTRRFQAMNQGYLDRNLHLVKAQGLFHPILTLLTGLAMVVVLWVGGGEVMRGPLSVGDFVAFIFYLNLLTWPLIALGWVVNLLQRGEASMGRIRRILDTEPDVVPGVGRSGAGAGAERFRGGIVFEGVRFTYPGTDRPVLRDVSFTVEPGQTVAIVGATGSGKSTLVSLLPRLYDPTAGRILLGGVQLSDFDPEALRAHIAVVPQDAFLFADTVAANLGLGLREEGAEAGGTDGASGGARAGVGVSPRILEAAQKAQLHDQILGFPRGYQTLLGERGINLSGGQKQRTTLARALARDPDILVLDDALSAVDTQTETRILDALRHELKGRTAFLISHRVSAVMQADLILVLDDGRLVEEGTHETLMERNGVYASLLRRQLLEEEVAGVAGVAAAGVTAAAGV
jgi:ATP-binding cassette, subfamily B, multidrug efflux pump